MGQATLRDAVGVAACAVAGFAMALAAGWPADHLAAGAVPTIDHAGLARWAWLLQWLGMVVGCMALAWARDQGWQPVALRAAVLGLTWQLGTVWWLYIGLHRYAGLSAPAAVAAVAALGAYLASFNVLGALGWAGLCRGKSPARPLRLGGQAVVFAATWLAAELARAMLLTGFPWAAGGHAHLHGPLQGLLPWVGVYGVSALSAGSAALVALALVDRRGPRRVRVAALGGVALVGGALALCPTPEFTRSAGEFEALLLQGNVNQAGKFDPARTGEALGWHLNALSTSRADLALAPETAIPVLEQRLPAADWARLHQRATADLGVLLIGVPQGLDRGGQYNAMLGIGHPRSLLNAGDDGLYRYHKAHLVPFAEFTPPGFAWFTQRLNLPLPDFQPGPEDAAPLTLRTRGGTVQRVAPIICFEDLFGEALARRFLADATAPTVLANGSNLAWFDDSPAIAQHLRIAQLRSREFERPSLRATNTGATALIDHQGQLVRALAPDTRGTLGVVVDGRTGTTPYAWWVARAGLWPLVAGVVGVLGLAYRARMAAGTGRTGPRRRAWFNPAARTG